MGNSIKANSILNAIKTGASIAFPLISFPYVNRILLPDNIGKVDFAASFVSYYALIASLGIATYAIRECAAVRDNRERLDNVASQIFSINCCTTVVAYASLFLTLLFARKLDNYRTLIMIESLSIAFTTAGADWLNMAMEDFRYITLRTIAIQFLSLLSMFLLIHTPGDYIKYAWITVLSSTGANLINMRYRKRYCRVRFTWHMNLRRHLEPIFLLFTMTLSQTIFNHADVTMLGFFCGDYQVGLYSTAHKVTRVVGSVVQSLIMVILPKLSYLFANDDYEGANRLLRKVLLLNIGLGLPCVTGVLMIAPDIAWLIGGDAFLGAAPVMRILILSFMFSLVGGSFLGNAVLIPTRNEKYYMIICCITAVANVILNAILIPFFAASGAAIATAFNGFLILLLLLLKVDKRIHVDRLTNVFLGPVAGCLAIALCCSFTNRIASLPLRLSCSIGFSAVVYAICLKLFHSDFINEILGYFTSIARKLCHWRKSV